MLIHMQREIASQHDRRFSKQLALPSALVFMPGPISAKPRRLEDTPIGFAQRN